MVYKTSQIKKIVGDFIKALQKEITVERVILFGSYAWGSPKNYSDIDLAVVSKDFKEKKEIQNMQYLFKKASKINSALEPHPYNPRELRRPDKRTLIYRILTRGKEIQV